MPTKILLIRHGQTAWNREDRFRGQADIPLDETGLWQAQVTGEYVAARWEPLTAVYASSLGRAVRTAEAVADAQNLPVEVLEGLLDIDYGDLQGMLTSEARSQHPNLLQAWFETPHVVRFPGGEGLDDVRQRAAGALQEARGRHAGESIALVAHTVVNRVILCLALDLGNDYFWRIAQGTCAVNLLEWDGERYRLELVNDTGHLWRASR